MSAFLRGIRRIAAGSVLLLAGVLDASAAGRHALTLYDEAPKYPAGFAHFDYVNPDAPKGGTLRQAGLAASTASTRSSTRAWPPTRSVWSTTP